MVAGMLPSALAWGAGGEFRSPMAIAVIGGLIVSTLLSLLFVPAFFAMMDDFGLLCWRVFGRFIGGADGPASGHAAKPPAVDAHSSDERGAADQPGKSPVEASEPAKAG